MQRCGKLILPALFALALCANFVFWWGARDVRAAWDNVPAAPAREQAVLSGLGDKGMSYRLSAYALQNFGNTGGRYEPARDYDYDRLEEWLFLTDGLDPRSDYVPFMAAYLLGATDQKEQMATVVGYLRHHGKHPYPDKWRWLAQAIYKARFEMEDYGLALEMAHELAALDADVAPWGRQMPAFINLQLGNKEAAYAVMLQMFQSQAQSLDPAEVLFMLDFICHRTLPPEELADNPLCRDGV